MIILTGSDLDPDLGPVVISVAPDDPYFESVVDDSDPTGNTYRYDRNSLFS